MMPTKAESVQGGEMRLLDRASEEVKGGANETEDVA